MLGRGSSGRGSRASCRSPCKPSVSDRQNRDEGAAGKSDFLRRVPLFQDLDPAQLARLAEMAREESHPGHQLLFCEGDAVDTFYLVREGAVTGIAFEDGKVGDEGVIYRALRRFLDRRG